MAKFRKKPVIIEAMQFDGDVKQAGKGPSLIRQAVCDTPHMNLPTGPHIHTLEGAMTVSVGDWIIRGVAGEFYPCKPDIFEQTYEPVP